MAHQDVIFLHSSVVQNAEITPAWGLECHAEGWHKDTGVAGVMLGLPQAQGPYRKQAPSFMSNPTKPRGNSPALCGRAFSAPLGLTYSEEDKAIFVFRCT